MLGAGWLWLLWPEKVAVAACHLPMLGFWLQPCWPMVVFLCALKALLLAGAGSHSGLALLWLLWQEKVAVPAGHLPMLGSWFFSRAG